MTVLKLWVTLAFVMSELQNPLDMLNIRREHIVALHEAYTQTNKKTSPKRAEHLLELFQRLQQADHERSSLFWDDLG